MKILIALVCLVIGTHIYSQTIKSDGVFATSGNLSNSYAQISWTIGDFQTQTYSTDNLVLTQGFLQSDLTVINITNVENNTLIELDVFPNPILDYLNIKYTVQKETAIVFHLYSLNGSLMYSKETKAKNYSETLNFNQFEGGTYILKAFSKDGSFIKTYKLFYQNH